MPTVSIVVPTYRRPDFLAQALDSVLAQTMPDLEVLVCDNAADPATAEVVNRLNDRRIIYCPRPENLGMLRNALLGFQQASSPLVVKLDDDDLLVPDALERLVAPFADHPDLMLSCGGIEFMDEHAVTLSRDTAHMDRTTGRDAIPEGLIRPATRLVTQGAAVLAAAVLRKDAVDWRAIPDDVATSYDLYLTLKAVEDGRPAWFTKAPVVRYRVHSGSDTNRNLGPQAQGAIAVLTEAIAGGRHEDGDALRHRLAEVLGYAGRVELDAGDRARARQTLRRSVQMAPTAPAIGLLTLSYLPTGVFRQVRNLRARLSRRAWPGASSSASAEDKHP